MSLIVPDFALLVLVGASESGKAGFAARHFGEGALLGPELDFEESLGRAAAVLSQRQPAILSRSSVERAEGQKLKELSRYQDVAPLALAIGLDQKARRSIKSLTKQGIDLLTHCDTAEAAAALDVLKVQLPVDRRHDRGPFDIVGDIHGCFEELTALLNRLGYRIEPHQAGGEAPICAHHPEGRKLVFLGDLVDRGPRNVDCLRLAMGMTAEGSARCVMGNHEHKLLRWLAGRPIKIGGGLDVTIAELKRRSDGFKEEVAQFLEGLLPHHWLAEGQLVAAHAGLAAQHHGRMSPRIEALCLYGKTTGERDAYGLPERIDWAAQYSGAAEVVYGHTPVAEAEWFNKTINLDTGCVFGGRLTALRWPERELVSVPAVRVHKKRPKPFRPARRQAA